MTTELNALSDIDTRRIDPRTDPAYPLSLDLRYRVLREPIGMGRHQVTFEGEEAALYIVAVRGDAIVGCVLFDFASGRLRQMAVEPSLQRVGVGRRLVVSLEHHVGASGVREVTLHARAPAVPFYERLGYVIRGAPFVEVGLPHREMHKTL